VRLALILEKDCVNVCLGLIVDTDCLCAVGPYTIHGLCYVQLVLILDTDCVNVRLVLTLDTDCVMCGWSLS